MQKRPHLINLDPKGLGPKPSRLAMAEAARAAAAEDQALPTEELTTLQAEEATERTAVERRVVEHAVPEHPAAAAAQASAAAAAVPAEEQWLSDLAEAAATPAVPQLGADPAEAWPDLSATPQTQHAKTEAQYHYSEFKDSDWQQESSTTEEWETPFLPEESAATPAEPVAAAHFRPIFLLFPLLAAVLAWALNHWA